MENFKKVVGTNLTKLRKSKNLTQAELANKFNYSDKAVSKWEKGDTLPDTETLYELCEFYNVTLDYLTHETNQEKYIKESDNEIRNKVIIVCLLEVIVWAIATMIFVYTILNNKDSNARYWLAYVWAIPISSVLLFFCNKKEFKNKKLSFITFSITIWTVILSFFLTFIEHKIWPIFLLGIPIQVIIVLVYAMKRSN